MHGGYWVCTVWGAKCYPSFSKNSFLSQAAGHLEGGRYKRSLESMKSSKTYNDFIIGSVCKQIQKEMKSSGPIFNIDSRNKTKSFESYSWKTANKSLKNKCPTLMTILGSTVERKLSKKDDVRLTMIAAQLFFVRCPAKHKVLQELIGLLLWFAGTNRKTFQRLNRLGISSGIKATTKTIDALRSEFDVTIHQQRQRITELQSTSRKAKRELFSDEWEDLTEWVKVLVMVVTVVGVVVIVVGVVVVVVVVTTVTILVVMEVMVVVFVVLVVAVDM
ncbi:uncharacterized protein LOC115927694 [Strongylocentrotus purpuratus]|uniref:Uncharacterized protein n=1 Tax=Strongylocentrotus purpuratus TaxID=7668 RepID=A0A7M7PI64_STRPU|nr:uncharacterized protein LOC115927694 [Strongylocentrotus purpuratus]